MAKKYVSDSKMNSTMKDKWLKALRSGDYKQGKDNLAVVENDGTVTGYCCLGVLCDIAKFKRVGYNYTDKKGTTSSGGLCSAHLVKFGLGEDDASNLMTMNDDKKKGFKAIANWIEKNIPVKPSRKKAA